MDVVAISAGGYHALALKRDGTVVAWGANGFGQSTVPSNVTDIKQISAGSYYSVALGNNGTVYAWGRNDNKQIEIPEGYTNVAVIGDNADVDAKGVTVSAVMAVTPAAAGYARPCAATAAAALAAASASPR